KAGHVLGGRFIESFITSEAKSTSSYALAWYDVGAKKYRQWLFDGTGKALEMSGSWDEKEKTLTWTSPDGRLERRWTFKNDDRREFVNRFIDKRDGPVTEATGVSVRQVQGVPRKAADVLPFMAGNWKRALLEPNPKLP